MLDANRTLKVTTRMNEQWMPTHCTRRVSLTKSQLRTDLGAQLLSLCESVTADGKLAPEEARGLREWLNEADAADLPAATYLREVVERILADGQITREECREVYRAVEAVLPPGVRRQVLVVDWTPAELGVGPFELELSRTMIMVFSKAPNCGKVNLRYRFTVSGVGHGCHCNTQQ